MLPVERWFGSALRCSINWRSSDACERVARAFAPSIGSSGYLMSWWWPASRRRTRGYLTRSGSSAGAFTGIALIWKYRSHGRWRGGRPGTPSRKPLVKESVTPTSRSPRTVFGRLLRRLRERGKLRLLASVQARSLGRRRSILERHTDRHTLQLCDHRQDREACEVGCVVGAPFRDRSSGHLFGLKRPLAGQSSF